VQVGAAGLQNLVGRARAPWAPSKLYGHNTHESGIGDGNRDVSRQESRNGLARNVEGRVSTLARGRAGSVAASPVGATDVFLVVFQTVGETGGCGWNADIVGELSIKVDGFDSSNNVTTSHWRVVRTEFEQPISPNADHYYTLGSERPFWPTSICVKASPGDEWCLKEDRGVLVFDAQHPMEEFAYGAASNFTELGTGEEHCGALVM